MKAKNVFLFGAGLGLACLGAHAQSSGLTITNGPSSATLYGLIDVTLGNVNAAGQSTTKPEVAWFSGNRWGILGQRTLPGGDLKAVFRLESEFVANTGEEDTPGVLFNRQAWLGLESKSMGRVIFGRQNAIGRDPMGSATYADTYSNAKANIEEGGYTNTNNFKQLVYYAGSAMGTRVNNGVAWKKEFDNGLIAGAQYSFGGVTNSFDTNSTKTVTLAYNGSNFTVAGFATNASRQVGATTDSLTHQSYSIGGNVQVTPFLRLNAGYFNYNAKQAAGVGDRKDNAWTVSTKLTPGGAWDYELGYQVMHTDNAIVDSKGYVPNAFADMSTVRATATGDRTTTYGSLFYHFDTATEMYFAFDHLATTGGYLAAQAGGDKSADEVVVGMRFKF